MDDGLKAIGDKALASLPGAVLAVHDAYGELTLEAEAARIVEVLTFLRDDPDCQFVCFTDISGVDYPQREKRFDVVYLLLSPKLNRRVRVKIATDETTPLRSRRSFPPPTGTSAKPTTCSASCSTAIPIFAASSPTTASTAIRCARTSR